MQANDRDLDPKILIAQSFRHDIYRRPAQGIITKKVRYSEDYHLHQERMRQEFAVGSIVDNPYLIHHHQLHNQGENCAIDMEDFQGVSLANLLESGKLPREIIWVIKGVLGGMEALHALGIAHGVISPGHVLINPQTKQLKLIDYSHSSFVSQAKVLSLSEFVGSELAYVAPEKFLEAKTRPTLEADYYSLGVTLYELLTGEKPMLGMDVIDIRYFHAHGIFPSLPGRVEHHAFWESFLARLIHKDPAARLCEAKSIYSTLEKFLEVSASDQTVKSLGAQLHLRYPSITRLHEQQILKVALHTVQKGGSLSLAILGEAGCGKSDLVRQFLENQDSGLEVIEIHFQEQKIDSEEPLKAMLESYFQRCLLLPEKEYAKEVEAMGILAKKYGDALGHWWPSTKKIFNTHTFFPFQADLHEAVCLYETLILDFIKCNARPEKPLVLWVDDLHWIESIQLQLLNKVITAKIPYLMVVLTARPEALEQNRNWKKTPPTAWSTLQKIELGSFSEGDFRHYLENTLWDLCGTKTLSPSFMAHVKSVTDQRPLWVKQYLQWMANRCPESLISCMHADWSMPNSSIITSGPTESLLLILKQTHAVTYDLLVQASLCGRAMDISILGQLSALNSDNLEQMLQPAIALGLVEVSSNQMLGFTHDEILLAFVNISKSRSHDIAIKYVHLHYENYTKSLSIESLALAWYFCRKWELEPWELMSENFLSEVIDVLRYNEAKSNFEENLNLGLFVCAHPRISELNDNLQRMHFRYVYRAYQALGNMPEALKWVERSKSLNLDVVERAGLIHDEIKLLTLSGNLQGAYNTFKQGLRVLDFEYDDSDLDEKLEHLFDEVKRMLNEIGHTKFHERPICKDPRIIAVIKMFNIVSDAMFMDVGLSRQFYALLSALRCSMQHGLTPEIAPLLKGYIVISNQKQHSHYEHIDLINSCEKIVSRAKAPYLWSSVKICSFFRIKPYMLNYANCQKDIVECGMVAYRSGNFMYTIFSSYIQRIIYFFSGRSLHQFEQETKFLTDVVAPLGNSIGNVTEDIFENILLLMRGHEPKLNLLDDENFRKTIVQCHENGKNYCAMLLTSIKCYCDYLCGEDDQFQNIDETLRPLMEVDSVLSIEMGFLYVWVKSSRGDVGDSFYEKILKKIRRLSTTCPENFLAKRAIAEGEILRNAKDYISALAQYDQALQAAAQYGQPQIAALALRRCAEIQRRLGLDGLARGSAQQASDYFDKWGSSYCAKRCRHSFDLEVDEGYAPQSVAPVLASKISELSTDADYITLQKINLAMLGAVEKRNLVEEVQEILFFYICAKEALVEIEGGEGCWLRGLGQGQIGRQTSSLGLLGDKEAEKIESLKVKLMRLGKVFCEDITLGTGRVLHVLALPIFSETRQWGTMFFFNDSFHGIYSEHQIQVLNYIIPQICLGLQMFESKEELLQLNEHLEQKVSDRTAALKMALEKAELLSQAKSDFVAKVSHDIRTPLNSILGFSKLSEETQSLSTQAGHANIIHRCGKHILALLNDILDLSRLESGAMPLNLVPCDIGAMLLELEDMFRLQAAQKGLGFSVVQQAGIPKLILQDDLKIKQLLVNLVANAMKFTLKGSVSVHGRGDSENLYFEVVDTGIGIAENKIPELFNPYEQACASTSRNFGGSGLGLSICRELTTLMGGTITVSSLLGKGSTFELSLPYSSLEKANYSLSGEELMGSTAMSCPDLSQEIILVLDDDPFQRQLLLALLQDTGAEMFTCATPEEAEAMMCQSNFSILLVDLHLAQDNGEDWIAKILEKPHREFRKCILMTGETVHQVSPSIKEKVVLLRKPFMPEALYALFNTRSA
jgi:signal transduction histidine kinase/serine/threonine protein kinase/CheY-like chemotaxis protein/tetratricopeptide (TPR) repeat protein